MEHRVIYRFIFSLALGIALLLTCVISMLHARQVDSPLFELDIDKVLFLPDIGIENRQHIAELELFAMDFFASEGLHPILYGTSDASTKERIGKLVLSMDFVPLTDSDKIIYLRSLKFFEPVRPISNPSVVVLAPTWRYTVTMPTVREELLLEELKKEVRRLLSKFIRAYKEANPDQ